MKKTQAKKTPPRATTRRRTPAKVKKAKAPRRTAKPPAVVVEPVPEVVRAADEIPAFQPGFITAEPEREFAARAVTVEPDRPLPAVRRAIFFDVENTSRSEHIARVIDHLAVDRMGRRTDFVAVGNWKVIGQDTARLLARHGAQLVHSAPSVGVRDWSDLRIAVAAGVWLAGARAGDAMEIITNDRAFDAVGDVAAGLGIVFRRLSYQGLAGTPAPPPPVEESSRDAAREGSGRRRRRGRRYGWRDSGAPAGSTAAGSAGAPAERETRTTAPPVAPPPPVAPVPLSPPVPRELPRPEVGGNGAEPPTAEPHTAPHDEIIAIVRELIQRSPARTVSIDTVANALKSRGFSRTPGSPRLITRLRRIKEITVNRAGLISLLEAGARAPQPEGRVTFEPVLSPMAPAEAPAERAEVLAARAEESSQEVEASTEGGQAAESADPATGPAELPAERIGRPSAGPGSHDYLEEPGDSVGNVAPPADAPRPPQYRRPQQRGGDRRRFPRPQRAPV